VPTVAPDVVLHPLNGKDRTLGEQVAFFHLVAVVLDPYTYESSWLLDTAGRILINFSGADARTALVLTSDVAGAREFVGPWADQLMVFADPDRDLVKALDLAELPAFVHVAHDVSVTAKAEGWDPETWRPITEELADTLSWSRPVIPLPGDPRPFQGTRAVPA
jgi:hypothetical protein